MKKIGRRSVKCKGFREKQGPWSREEGEDPEMDYLMQFASWRGFDSWLESIKNKSDSEKFMKKKIAKPKLISREYDSLLKSVNLLLEYLPDIPVNDVTSDFSKTALLSNEELEKMEMAMMRMFRAARHLTEDDSERLSAMSRSLKYHPKKTLTMTSFVSRKSKKRSVANQSDPEAEDKASDKVLEKKKDKSHMKKAKVLSQEELVVEEDPCPKSLMPELLELFDEFDAIKRDKENFHEIIKDVIYPYDHHLSQSPQRILIKGYNKYQVKFAPFYFYNIRTRWLQVTFDKILSTHDFQFKVIGPELTRLAPGGYQDFILEFYTDLGEDVQANIKFLIKSYDQSITQRLIQVNCFAVGDGLALSTSQVSVTPMNYQFT